MKYKGGTAFMTTRDAAHSPKRAIAVAVAHALRSAAAIAIAAPATAFAAAQPASPAPSEIIAEVLVTAQKRLENIQDIPATVQAIAPETLERFNYTDFEDYARLVPTLNFEGSNVTGSRNIRLRGISPSTGDPTVAFYVDETPLQDNARSGTPDPRIFDIERIEVLRGPQGNLYGASSMAGTIKIITAKPDTNAWLARVGTDVSVTAHGGPSYEFTGMLNAPLITDRVGLRTAVFARHAGGFVDRAAPFPKGAAATAVPDPQRAAARDTDIDDLDVLSVRVAATIEVADWLTLTPSVFYQNEERGGPSEMDAGFDRSSPTQLRYEDERSSDEFTLSNLTATVSLPVGEIVSSTSYFDRSVQRQLDYTGFLNSVFGPLTLGDVSYIPPNSNLRDTRDFFQEIRFASQWSFPVDLLLGAFYTSQDRPFYQSFIADGAQAAGVLPVDLLFVQNAQSQRDEYAVFGNLTYRFLERFEVQAGARWFHIEQDDHRIADGLFNGTLTDEITSATDEDVNLAFAVAARLTPDHMLYARAAQGFRAGFTFTPPPRTPNCDADLRALGLDPLSERGQVEADSLWNYELGAKTDWAGGRVRANAALYVIEFSDIQQAVQLPTCGFGISGNVGKARSRGAELELMTAPAQGFDLTTTLGYVEAELRADAPPLGAISGEPLTSVPEWTISTVAEYAIPTRMLGRDAFVRASYRYVDTRTTDFGTFTTGPTTAGTLDEYDILDVAFGLTAAGWEATLYVDNVADERVEYSNDNLRGLRSYGTNRPRTVGIRFRKEL